MNITDYPDMRFEGLQYYPFRDACEWDSVVIGRTLRLTWLEATELCPLIVLRDIDRRALETARREHWDAASERLKEARWRDQS